MNRVMFGSVTVSGWPATELLEEQRNDRSARGHHVAVARDAETVSVLACDARSGDGHLLHHRLRHAHGVDGVDRLVGAEHDDLLHAAAMAAEQRVVGADDVGADGLHRVELARRHLLEGRGVKDVVHAGHRVAEAVRVAHVADVELELRRCGTGAACRPASSRRGRRRGSPRCRSSGSGGGRRCRTCRCRR